MPTNNPPTILRRQTLAEQLAEAITENIIAGKWQPGDALPTEPELAEQFEVSRAVVRDATRMLVARGLVDAQHGRGVFITDSPVEAFGDALLLALRRAGATAWDIERFEQMVLPEVLAEAARMATEEEVAEIVRLASEYYDVFGEVTRRHWDNPDLPAADRDQVMAAFRGVYGAIFAATHNALWTLLAGPLLRLRLPRSWKSTGLTAGDFIARERRVFEAQIKAISAHDPDQARQTAQTLMRLPPAAEAALRATPIGEVPHIPLPLTDLTGDDQT
jgi:GntR family transcriptional regulator, transcriptional repressor for pyruvate dehydrogenase complex